MIAAVLMSAVLVACQGDDGSAADTTSGTGSTNTTVATSTTVTAATTTPTPPSTTTTEPQEVHPFDWQALEVAEFESREKGGGFGAIVPTPSGNWLLGGSVIDEDGIPRPMVWHSADGLEWEPKELPTTDRGMTVMGGAWSGDTGLLAGHMAGPGSNTTAVVWTVDESGNGDLVEVDTFPVGMEVTKVEAQPGGGFVLAGWSADRSVLFRSEDGRNWTRDPRADEMLDDLTFPFIRDLAAGDLGLLVMVVDERGQNDLGVLLLDRGDGLEEVARIEHESDVDLNGAVVTGAQFQVYGAVRSGSAYESAIWVSHDGDEWSRSTPTISIDDGHLASNVYGNAFIDAVRDADGLVGVVFEANSYLFVGSEDGTDWTEIPIEGGVEGGILDTDVPFLDEMAASGGVVLATSTELPTPFLFRVEGGRATQVVHDALPMPLESVTITDSVVDGNRVVTLADRVGASRHLSEEGSASSQVVAVGLDGEVEASEPVPDLLMSGIALTSDGVAAVGYERFIARWLGEGTIDPRAWWGSTIPELTEVDTGSPPEERTKRLGNVAVIDAGLVGFGTHFIETGVNAPIFWYSADGKSWEEVPAPDERATINVARRGLCVLPDGGAMAIGRHQTESGPAPATWVTADGRSWDLTVSGPERFAAEGLVELWGCLDAGDRTIVLGSVGTPSVASAWETTDGREFTPIETPDAGASSRWWSAAVGPDGSLYLLGRYVVEGESQQVLGVVGPDGTESLIGLEVEALMGPTGPAALSDLYVVDDHLVLLGTMLGDARIWTAPLSP